MRASGRADFRPPFEWISDPQITLRGQKNRVAVDFRALERLFDDYGSELLKLRQWSVNKEASQTRDCCVAKNTTQRAARLDPSLRKKRLFRMTIILTHYRKQGGMDEIHLPGIYRARKIRRDDRGRATPNVRRML